MENKILPIRKSKVVDYSNEPLQNFWQQKADDSSIAKNHRAIISELLQSVTEGIVCIQTEVLTDKKIIEQIFGAARGREVKIYILVNNYSQELDMLNEVCFIRYGLQNIGTFVLTNPNSNTSDGIFFGGQLTEQSIAVTKHISRKLSKEETTDLFRHYCFHFWETAKKEVIEKGKHTDVTSKPLDVFHDVNAFGDKDFVYSTLFNFVGHTNRGNLSNKLIVPFKKENLIPIHIIPIENKDLGEINTDELLPEKDFKDFTPNLLDNGISCKIEYLWTNLPFYLPEKCSDSPLYEKWKKESEKIINHIGLILERIDFAEKKENTISKILSRFFLGKKTAFQKLKSDIKELKQIDFANISERELKENISNINKIYQHVESEIGEIEQEDRKAKLDEEIENLKSIIGRGKTTLTEKQNELNVKQDEADKRLNAFLEKHKIEKSLLGKVISDWQQQSGQKNQKNNPEVAKEAEAKLSELNEIQNKVFINKLKTKIEDIEKDIKRKEEEIKRKENEKSKSTQQPETKSSLDELVSNQSSKQNPTNTKTYPIPDLPQLPKTGKLYMLNSQSYLAIEYWEQYEQGKSESERLKAKLCTIKI